MINTSLMFVIQGKVIHRFEELQCSTSSGNLFLSDFGKIDFTEH